MATGNWQEAVALVAPYVVQIKTPDLSGTGFLFTYSGGLCGIATAAHVIAHADAWEQPIRLIHATTGKQAVVHHHERACFVREELDSGALVTHRKVLPFPDTLLDLMPVDKFLKVGNEIGWLGFPAVAPNSLCFFLGTNSAFVESERTYLVDGVAINGVSGGPVFCVPKEPLVVIGLVSAYKVNRARGEALPGLAAIRDLKHFQELIQSFQSLDQAKKAQEQEVPSPGAETVKPPNDDQPS